MKKTERFLLVLGPDTIKALDKASKEMSLSKNEIIRRAIYKYLNLDIDGREKVKK